MNDEIPPKLAELLDAIERMPAELAAVRAAIATGDLDETRRVVEMFAALEGPLASGAVQ